MKFDPLAFYKVYKNDKLIGRLKTHNGIITYSFVDDYDVSFHEKKKLVNTFVGIHIRDFDLIAPPGIKTELVQSYQFLMNSEK